MGRRAKGRRDRISSNPSARPSVAAAPRPVDSARPTTGRWIFAAVTACFVLSGSAGLLYQTAWTRAYALVLGTSEDAVAVVLAAFMGGLAIGAAVSARLVDRVRRPVLVFGVLELGVGLTGLALPSLLSAAGALYAAGLGGAPEPVSASGTGQLLYRIGVSVALLLPTSLMGATLPLLTRFAVQRDVEVAPRVAALYGANTAGAVGGALLGGFVLLPAVGLAGTLGIAARVNGVVFILAVLLTRLAAAAVGPGPAARDAPALRSAARRFHWILPLMCVSGAVSLACEVVWTRLLSHVLGSSIAAFATMLASFLTGIALGTAAVAWIGDRRRAGRAFAVVQAGIAVSAGATHLWLQGLAPADLPEHAPVLAMLVMLPATLFIGATFPLAVRILAADESAAASSAGRVYAWNTLGAIAGALGAGFWMVPALGFEGSSRLLVGTSLGLAVAAFAGIVKPRPLPLIAATAVAVLACLLYQPGLPRAVIDASLVDTTVRGEARFFAVGRSATVLVKEHDDGYFYLRTNGLPEAAIARRGVPPLFHSQRWLTALPLAARPEAHDLLVIGLGGGVAIESLPARVRRIDVIELEPEVVAANRAIGGLRAADPLADPRVRLIENDARNALSLTARRYDVIVSQPSHPWTAGASHLYTREFLELARERLTPGGVLVQWINTQFIGEALLRSLVATLQATFPHVRLYQPEPMELMFLASTAPLDAEDLALGAESPLVRESGYFAMLGIRSPEDLAAALAADETGLARVAAGAPVITDDRNRMATDSGPAHRGLSGADTERLLLPADPLLRVDDHGTAQLRTRLNLGYTGTRLVALGLDVRARALSDTLEGRGSAWLIRAAGLAAAGQSQAADRARQRAFDLDAADPDVVFSLLRRQLSAIATGRAPPAEIDLVGRLPDSGQAVVEGWGAAAHGAWPALAALEPRLAATPPTGAWYPEATQLRAEWRTKAGHDEAGRRLAAEAIALVDNLLAAQPGGDAFVIRAAAEMQIDDAAAFVESASSFVTDQSAMLKRIARAQGRLSPESRRTLQARLDGFRGALGEPFVAPAAARAAQARARIDSLSAELERLPR